MLKPITLTTTFFAACSALFLVSGPPPVSAQSQVSGAGSTSTNFQKIGMGARAVGMGEAYTAVSDDATAIFWNPAGLILAKGTQFSLTHGEWLQGVKHEFFAFSQNIDKDGAFGGSVGYLGTGSFEGSLETPAGLYGGVGDTISATNYAGSVAYAQRLGNWLGGDFFKKSMLGLKVTVVGQNVVNVGSAGAAFDIGYMYEIQRKKFYVGAVVYNLGTSIQNFSQPLIFKLGGSYRLTNLLMKKDRNTIALSTDGHIDTGVKFDLGNEYRMAFGRNAVALRVGYRTGSDLGGLAGLTSGVGVSRRFEDFEAGLDYAFVPYGILGDSHRVSLNVAIGGTMVLPEAFVTAPPSFTLAQQSLPVNFATKSEEPIDKWKVTVLDTSGMLVKTFEGKGNPPSKYVWDGRNQAGVLVPQGNYSFNLEVTNDEDFSAKSRPREVYAKWVPKKVPYQYTFQVPGDLLFDSGKDELLTKGYDAIQKAAGAIRARYPDSLIIVAGHTDNVAIAKGAKFKDNQELSQARAKAVMEHLVKNGMDHRKLSAMGYGDAKPIADNKTKEGKAKNRRVELVVSGVMEATVTDLIAEGMSMMKQKRYRDALERFLKGLESDSRSAEAYKRAGDCYLLLGGKDQAIASYRKSVEYNPKDTALKDWLRQYAPAPKVAPAPAAPANNTAPAAQPANNQPAVSPSNPPPPAPEQPAAPAPTPVPQAAPAAAPANNGMPMPVEAN